MKEQCFFLYGRLSVGEAYVADLSRDKTEMSRGGGRRWWMQEDGSQLVTDVIDNK